MDTTERLHFRFSLSCLGEGNGNPLQCSCLENPRDGGAWWAADYGVAQSLPWDGEWAFWGEVYPGAGSPSRAEDEDGGRLSGARRALSGRVHSLPAPPGHGHPVLPPLFSYSITLGTGPGSACPFTAPGQRRRRRGLCPLPPGYPAKLPELRGHFASSSRSELPGPSGPPRGPPISAQRFSVLSAAMAGFHPGSSFSPLFSHDR